VTLNGADITSVISVAPENFNSLGAPTAARLSGILPAVAGTNRLVISASDLAGNSVAIPVSFIVEPPPILPPRPEERFVLRVISGGGQVGVTGRCLRSPVVMQVTRASDGSPAKGVSVALQFIEGGGTIVRSPRLTDEAGITQVEIRLGLRPGPNRVRAGISGFPQGPFVEFVAEGRSPDIAFFLPPRELHEFPGCALPGTILVQVSDFEGIPLQGVEVMPEVFPLVSKMGRFHPQASVTDANGQARFAFEIFQGAPPGDFFIRFTAPDFLDGEGRPVSSALIPARVKDPQNRIFNLIGGQGQVVLPGNVAPAKLEVELLFPPGTPPPDPDDQFSALIRILDGTGTLLEGGAPEDGTLTLLSDTEAFVLTAPGRTRFRFRYRKGAANRPELVEVQGTDVFVIGVPEVFFVDSGGNRLTRLHAMPVTDFSARDTFRVRVLTEAGGSVGSVEIMSLDSCFSEVGEDGIGIAPKVVSPPGMMEIPGSEPRRMSVFKSSPLLVTEELMRPSAMPTGVTVLHVMAGGGLECRADLGSVELRTPKTTVGGISARFNASVFNEAAPVAVVSGIAELMDPAGGSHPEVSDRRCADCGSCYGRERPGNGRIRGSGRHPLLAGPGRCDECLEHQPSGSAGVRGADSSFSGS
jgi:hypothetical protein